MDYDKLVELIELYGGEENVLGFGFDNSSATTFSEKGQFTIDGNLNKDLNCIIYIEFDFRGNHFHVIKPLETIQSVYFKDSNVALNVYDKVSVRG